MQPQPRGVLCSPRMVSAHCSRLHAYVGRVNASHPRFVSFTLARARRNLDCRRGYPACIFDIETVAEESFVIAWDYLERAGGIDDPDMAMIEIGDEIIALLAKARATKSASPTWRSTPIAGGMRRSLPDCHRRSEGGVRSPAAHAIAAQGFRAFAALAAQSGNGQRALVSAEQHRPDVAGRPCGAEQVALHLRAAEFTQQQPLRLRSRRLRRS